MNTHTTSFSGARELARFSRYGTAAYLLATVILCFALVYSYSILKRNLIEQANLYALQSTTSELWIEIRKSAGYLSDLKQAEEQSLKDSLLSNKINSLLVKSIKSVDELKEQTKSSLLALEAYPYYTNFYNSFYNPPNNILKNLDEYIFRLKEISAQYENDKTDKSNVWLPVEGTAANTGILGRNYLSAQETFSEIITQKSTELEKTHFTLSAVCLAIVFFELALIFFPLTLQLRRIRTNLGKAYGLLDKQANYDEVTGLFNAAGTEKWLSQNKSSELCENLAVISITNSDELARIIGPTQFNEFFVYFSETLKSTIPEGNMLFRSGDNTFAFLLTSEALDSFRNDFDSIDTVLTRKTTIGNSTTYPKLKYGCVSRNVSDESLGECTVDALIASQKYHPTEKRLPEFNSGLSTEISNEAALIEEIRDGISKNEFVPYYQLKVDAQTQKISGMEALCRWIRSDGTIRQPYEFIPLAEKSGLIADITWLLLQRIVENFNSFVASGLAPGRIAFNAAEAMLLEKDFNERLQAVLQNIEGSECPLDLEITETVALAASSLTMKEHVAFARSQGMYIALDDFGTGFASLSSIVDMDVDTIKVDKSFVQKMSECEDSRNIVASIIQLTRQLGKKSVVEGVETKEAWEFCRDQNCDEIQGYYFYKPETYENVLKALEDEQYPLRRAG